MIRPIRFLPYIFFLLLGVATNSCSGEKKEKKDVVRPVEYQEVSYSSGIKQRTFSGTARTEKIVNLSFRSSGILVELDVRLGQMVEKGQLLGKLDNVEARLNYERAVTSLNSAESQMNTAKLSLDRIRVLYEKGSASLTDFESAKNSFRNAEQGYESAKRQVVIQQEQINYGYLYAPENGVITSVSAEVDENISPGQTIAVLNAGTDMEISLGFPEGIINEVSVGMPVNVTFSSLDGQIFKGKISELSPAVDVNTATYPARVKLDESNGDIKSGMAANVTFELKGSTVQGQNLRIPAKAVGEDSQGRFVFLLVTDGEKTKVKRKTIKVGDLNSDGFEVLEGLQEGQLIATAGLQTLLDGQEVTVP